MTTRADQIAQLLNQLILSAVAKGYQQARDVPTPDDERITDADLEKIEREILATLRADREAAPAPQDQNSGHTTRHGGNCGTTPFYLHHGQRTPEYDQGDAVIVWYDDLYNLAERAARPGVAVASDEDSLRPCPFCGASASIIEVTEPSNVGGYVVQCSGCEASTRVWFPIKEDVTRILRDAWNQRPGVAVAPKEPEPFTADELFLIAEAATDTELGRKAIAQRNAMLAPEEP